MRFAELAAASRRIAATRARLEKTALLAELLRRLEPREVPIGVAYLSGHLRQGRIGVGWAMLESTLSSAVARPAEPAAATLFDAAAAIDSGAGTRTLELVDVDETFARVAAISGAGAAGERARVLRELSRRATDEEREFLVRLIAGELRQGALGGIMEDAVARASGVPLTDIRRAAMLSGDLEAVAVATLTEGSSGLARFRLELFRPVQPMLAQPAADLDAALERLGTAAFEHKLDGARIQVHRAGGEVRVYSRQLNDVTVSVPEVVAAVRGLPVNEIILDGEVVARRADGTPHSFQVTMRRFGRTLDVERMERELPLTTSLFDVLRLEGADLIDAPARERWRALRERAPELAVAQIITSAADEAAAFYDGALARGHEGVMAKALDAPYEAGGRGFAWLKIKAVHTLDLVVLAAEWGSGRRRGWLSNLHLGALDPETGGFVMLGKTFKGMTDEMLAWQTQEFQRLAIRTAGNVIHVRPELVVEVAFNDVQESPRYPGGMALRLARVKAYRPDKSPVDADTVEIVRAILRGDQTKRRA